MVPVGSGIPTHIISTCSLPKKIVDISKSVKIYGPQALSKCARMEWKATSGIAAVV